MKMKYHFIKQPSKGEFGEWETIEGFKCYTTNRATAIRMYKKWLRENPKKKPR